MPAQLRSEHTQLIAEQAQTKLYRTFPAFVAEWLKWVRKRLSVWSHVRVAAIGIRDGERLQNVWCSIVLVDDPKPPSPFGAPLFPDSEVCVFRTVLPMAALPTLILDLKRGEFPTGRFPGIDRFVLRCPDLPGPSPSGQRPEPTSQPRLLTMIRRDAPLEAPEQWSRMDLDFRTGALSEHFGQPFYQRLEAIDERLKTSVGSLAELGRKLGLREQSGHVNEVWHHPATIRLSAPLPLRIEGSPGWVDKGKKVVARVRVGKLVDRSAAALTIHDPLVPGLQKNWKLPRKPGRSVTANLRCSRPSPHAVLRLSYLRQQVDEWPLGGGGAMGIERTLRMLDAGEAKDDAMKRSSTNFGGWIAERRLGEGGQGEAWLARKPGLEGVGVLKHALPGKDKTTERRLERLRREADAIRLLGDLSPFVVRLLDSSGAGDPSPWLVTEYAPLGSVDDRAAIYRGDVWRTLRLARDVALGLGVAHANRLIHRDIKPANLVLFGPDSVKITDFGIGHDPDRTSLTTTGEPVRTRWFSPPEADRSEEPTPAWDVFMLGRTIYYLLAGEEQYPDFDLRVAGSNLVALLDRPDMELVNLLLDRMVDRDKNKRFSAMSEVATAIDRTIARLFGTGDPDRCRLCAEGRYAHVGRLRLLHPNTNIERPDGSLLYLDSTELGISACRKCGSAIAQFKTPVHP